MVKKLGTLQLSVNTLVMLCNELPYKILHSVIGYTESQHFPPRCRTTHLNLKTSNTNFMMTYQIYFFFKGFYFFKRNFYNQRGARPPKPEMKSCMRLTLSQPGAQIHEILKLIRDDWFYSLRYQDQIYRLELV